MFIQRFAGEAMRYPTLFWLAALTPILWGKDTFAADNCINKYAAKVVSLQGQLLIEANGKEDGHPGQLNEDICEGGRIHVQANSRASLLLPNVGVIRVMENTYIKLNRVDPNKTTLVEMVNGFIHFISRTPQKLEINTPIANAGPEGTEFAVSVDKTKASLWVYEGGVNFFNAKGSIHLTPGQGAQALLGQAPQARIDIKPQDAVNWALYYPPVLPYPDATSIVDSSIRTAIQDYRQGHLDIALNQLDTLSTDKQTPYFYKVRGAMRLTAGQDQLAMQDIQALLASNPNDAEALALQSVRALTQNRKDEAYALANKAVTANPKSASAYSALSYAEQGRFNLAKAQTAADQAVNLAPHDALVWARKAELELSQGLNSDSQQAAQKATELDANLERTQTIMGFSHLLHMNTDEALQSFNKAVELDSTSPLARLGLGLAKIRNGDLKEGRQDLEIAVILDPNNSIVRSYLGKAYYEERRSPLTDDQFRLAKERDPKDPTPYFYDAINKQTANRPVEALHDMQKAIELNDNRAVYRSNLTLDKDNAARTANFSRIYNDLGFGRIALKEAWKSLGYDSTNPSSHRFLSDAYIGKPRYRSARASELLQAQLLQPINITPVQPQLTGENIGILNSTGPGNLSVNEYDPLYNANGVHAVLNGAYGSNNTIIDNAILSGVYGNLSASLGQFYYQTDGFRQNDGYQQDIYDVFAQYTITPDLSIQLELKTEDIRTGDVFLRLNDAETHRTDYKHAIEHDTARVGGRYKINPEQDVIASIFYTTRNDANRDRNFTHFPDDPNDDYNSTTLNSSDAKGYQTELQYLYHPKSFDITAGFGYLNLKYANLEEQESRYIFPPTDVLDDKDENGNGIYTFSTPSKSETHHFNGYIYSKQKILPNLTTTLGLSFDAYNDGLVDRQQFNPKFGAIWNPIKSLTLRAAAFRTLKRPLAANQTIEPTQIAGFNQIFDSTNGTTAWNYALGVDYKAAKDLFLGGEISLRDTDEVFIEDNKTSRRRNESYSLAYIYWTPVEWLAFSSEHKFEKYSSEYTFNSGDKRYPRSVATHQIPLSLNFFHPSGFFAKFSGTFVDQEVELIKDLGAPPPNAQPLAKDKESFWTFDTTVGYRFPKRIGTISFEVRNLFDNKFRYQSAFDAEGPQLSPFVPQREMFIKLNLFY